MEIDPAALSRSNTNPRSSETPSIATKTLPGAGNAASKVNKTAPSVPRIDYEPFYAEIKGAIGDHWGSYKDAISQFLIGYLNQTELNSVISSFILTDPHREHLHNQLVCAIYANLSRDIPDGTVATWVSANDKPTNVPKPAAGDAAEQRLKSEVMQLPPRIRHRIKGIRDDPHKPLTHSLTLTRAALSLPNHHQPISTSGSSLSAPLDATSSTGLNRDLEIRRRYNLPLISETHDLPTPTHLTDRILPICYEEGLFSGLGSTAETTAALLDTALGIFLKDTLTALVSLTRVDAPVSGPRAEIIPGTAPAVIVDGAHDAASNYAPGLDRTGMGIVTAKYRRMLAAEEAAWARGEAKRSEAGLLPVEVAAPRQGGMGDLRIAWETDDPVLRGMMPWLGKRMGGWDQGEGEGDGEEIEMERDESGRRRQGGLRPAAVSADSGRMSSTTVNGVGGLAGDAEAAEEEDWGWQGGKMQDRCALADLLDECLNIEQ